MSTGILVRQRFQPAKTQRLCRTSLTGPSAAGSAAFGLRNNRTTAVDVKVMATVVKVGASFTEVMVTVAVAVALSAPLPPLELLLSVTW